MIRKFLYTSKSTIPIDRIKYMDISVDTVNIVTDSHTHYERGSDLNMIYEGLQRQLAEAEKC